MDLHKAQSSWEICFTDKSYSTMLKELKMKMWNINKCNSTNHWNGNITDGYICAGYESSLKSVCTVCKSFKLSEGFEILRSLLDISLTTCWHIFWKDGHNNYELAVKDWNVLCFHVFRDDSHLLHILKPEQLLQTQLSGVLLIYSEPLSCYPD